MNRFAKLCALMFVAACGDTATQPGVATDDLPTSFAKAEKIDICHYDEDRDRYFAKSITPSSEADHRAHGDAQVGETVPPPHAAGYLFDADCQPVLAPPPGPKVFAIAYSNMDGIPGFGAADRLIAKLVDQNGDDVVSVGDAVITNQYPTALPPGPSDFGAFNVTTHEVKAVATAHCCLMNVVVDDTPGAVKEILFWKVTGSQQSYYELKGAGFTGEYTVIIDVLSGSGRDFIHMDPTSASMPDPHPDVLSPGTSITDDPFIDVDINPAGVS